MNSLTVTVCPECNKGECFLSYDPAEAIIREQRIAAESAKTD